MTDPLLTLARYIKDLMGISKDEIVVGRLSDIKHDFNQRLIVVDSTTVIVPVTTSTSLSGENRAYNIMYKLSAQIDFLGNNTAVTDAYRLAGLILSGKSQELKQKYNITVYNTSSIQNLKWTNNKDRNERYMMNINVMININTVVDEGSFASATVSFSDEVGTSTVISTPLI